MSFQGNLTKLWQRLPQETSYILHQTPSVGHETLSAFTESEHDEAPQELESEPPVEVASPVEVALPAEVDSPVEVASLAKAPLSVVSPAEVGASSMVIGPAASAFESKHVHTPIEYIPGVQEFKIKQYEKSLLEASHLGFKLHLSRRRNKRHSDSKSRSTSRSKAVFVARNYLGRVFESYVTNKPDDFAYFMRRILSSLRQSIKFSYTPSLRKATSVIHELLVNLIDPTLQLSSSPFHDKHKREIYASLFTWLVYVTYITGRSLPMPVGDEPSKLRAINHWLWAYSGDPGGAAVGR